MFAEMLAVTETCHTVHIDLGDRSYPIVIAADLLGQAATFAACPDAAQAVIVTNTTVQPLYAAQLQAALAGKYRQVHTVVLPDGEAHKDWQTLNLIFDGLLTIAAERFGPVYASA